MQHFDYIPKNKDPKEGSLHEAIEKTSQTNLSIGL